MMNRRQFLNAGSLLSVAMACGRNFSASGDIVLGQSVSLSRPAKGFGIEIRDGALVWLKQHTPRRGSVAEISGMVP